MVLVTANRPVLIYALVSLLTQIGGSYPAELHECFVETDASDYNGVVNTTISGYSCLDWDVQDPHVHNLTSQNFPDLRLDENFCRNPNGELSAWCYTTDPTKRWDFCEVGQPESLCPYTECFLETGGSDYRGEVTTTIGNRTCQAWDIQVPHGHGLTSFTHPTFGLNENFCRNPDGEPSPWCYTIDPDKRWELCSVGSPEDLCPFHECFRETNGADYRGHVSVTVSNRTCQAWDVQEPHGHSSTSLTKPELGLDENYCRNPDGEPAPWCYTTDPAKRWELCDVGQASRVACRCEAATKPFCDEQNRLPCTTQNTCGKCKPGFYMVGLAPDYYCVADGTADCRQAPSTELCVSLNRLDCHEEVNVIPNTCGACLDGYLQLLGDDPSLPCTFASPEERYAAEFPFIRKPQPVADLVPGSGSSWPSHFIQLANYSGSEDVEESAVTAPSTYAGVYRASLGGNTTGIFGMDFEMEVKKVLEFQDDTPDFGTALHCRQATGSYISLSETRARVEEAIGPLPELAITVEGWVKMDYCEGWGSMFGMGFDTNQDEGGFYLGCYDNHLTWAVATAGDPNGHMAYLEGFVRLGEWMHYAGTYEYLNSTMAVQRMFVNGELMHELYKVDGGLIVWHQSNFYFDICSYHDDNEFKVFELDIDELRMWTVARTQEEVKSTMYSHLNGDEPGLVVYFTFDNDDHVAGIAFDSSPSQLHGTYGAASTAILEKAPDIVASLGASGVDHYLIELNGRLIYSVGLPQWGRELWSISSLIDEEQSGSLLKDVHVGAGSSNPRYLTHFGSRLVFEADDGVNGAEPWITDGTADGTVLLADINPGAASSNPREFFEWEGDLYFQANDGVHGVELWVSDGTTAGTRLVADINPYNSLQLYPTTSCSFAIRGSNGCEGAYAPTSSGSYPSVFAAFNGDLMFAGHHSDNGTELWRLEGGWQASGGDALSHLTMFEIRPGAGGSSPEQLTVVGDTLYFSAHSMDHDDQQMYRFHAGDAGPTEFYRSEGGSSRPREVHPLPDGSGILFSCEVKFPWGELVHLCTSDGVTGGDEVTVVTDLITADAQPVPLVEFEGKMLMSMYDVARGQELWETDGTLLGTTFIADIEPGVRGSSPSSPVLFGENVLLQQVFTTEQGGEMYYFGRASAVEIVVSEVVVAEEGAAASYPITLHKRPIAPVTVTITVTDASNVEISPSKLTFTQENWDVWQYVMVSAINNYEDQGESFTVALTHSSSSDYANYDCGSDCFYTWYEPNSEVLVTVVDNDQAGVKLSQDFVFGVENGDDAVYNVTLSSKPVSPVVISTDLYELEAAVGLVDIWPVNLTFAPEAWNVPQQLFLRLPDNHVDSSIVRGVGAQNVVMYITHWAYSADQQYQEVGSGLVLQLIDDDTAGVTVEPRSLRFVYELGSYQPLTYTIKLLSQPVEPVTVTLTSTSGESSVSPSSVVFDPLASLWMDGQVIRVVRTAQGVTTAVLDVIEHSMSSADPKYDGRVVASVDVSFEQPASESSNVMAVLLPVLAVVLVVAGCAAVRFSHYRKKMRSAVQNLETLVVITEEQANMVRRVMEEQAQEYESKNGELNHLSVKVDAHETKLISKLGSGAYGDVWLGELRGRPCALKRTRADAVTEEGMKGFRQEIYLLCRLRHPNIIEFYGACWEPPDIMIILELAEKGSLTDRLQDLSQPTLTWAGDKLQIALGIAKGMAYMHSQKPPVLHRDLKGANVLLTGDMTPKLADFGLSRALEKIDQTMTMAGTSYWIAPEVFAGEYYGEGCDVYSFSIVLCEMAMKEGNVKLMFGDDMQLSGGLRIMAQMGRGWRPDLTTLPCDLKFAPGLPELIVRCWQQTVTDRPSFSEIVTALKAMEKPIAMGELAEGFTGVPGKNIQPKLANHHKPKVDYSSDDSTFVCTCGAAEEEEEEEEAAAAVAAAESAVGHDNFSSGATGATEKAAPSGGGGGLLPEERNSAVKPFGGGQVVLPELGDLLQEVEEGITISGRKSYIADDASTGN